MQGTPLGPSTQDAAAEERAVVPPPRVPALEVDRKQTKLWSKNLQEKRNPESLRALALQTEGRLGVRHLGSQMEAWGLLEGPGLPSCPHGICPGN